MYSKPPVGFAGTIPSKHDQYARGNRGERDIENKKLPSTTFACVDAATGINTCNREWQD